MNRSIDLRIHNDLSEIGIVRDALDSLGSEFGIPMRALMQMQVALDEVVSNVVKYAWDDGEKHEFLVRIKVHTGGLELEIIDDGRAFDPSSAPAPKSAPEGQRPRPGGVGIHMVKQLVDGLAYARVEGRNHTTLTKKFEAGATAQRSET